MINLGFDEKRCKECGKIVIVRPNWLYKIYRNNKVDYYCSYNCWMADKNREPQRVIAELKRGNIKSISKLFKASDIEIANKQYVRLGHNTFNWKDFDFLWINGKEIIDTERR